jgi:hypothetical protein
MRPSSWHGTHHVRPRELSRIGGTKCKPLGQGFGGFLIVLIVLALNPALGTTTTIVNFAPQPASPSNPEFLWTGTALQTPPGYGTSSSGDGLLLGLPPVGAARSGHNHSFCDHRR